MWVHICSRTGALENFFEFSPTPFRQFWNREFRIVIFAVVPVPAKSIEAISVSALGLARSNTDNCPASGLQVFIDSFGIGFFNHFSYF